MIQLQTDDVNKGAGRMYIEWLNKTVDGMFCDLSFAIVWILVIVFCIKSLVLLILHLQSTILQILYVIISL